MTVSGPFSTDSGNSGWSLALSATALLVGTLLTLVDQLTQHHGFAVAAILLVLVHIFLRWPMVRLNARIMLAAAIALSIFHPFIGGTTAELALAASRALYLPALLAVMALLRVAAKQSRLVRIAAHFVVDQPPSRRFTFLSTGGHIFGILLNVGGFQLLLSIALAERDRTAPNPQVAEVQGRRITNAVLRGFSATMLWSPVGVAINLLIPIMPTLSWADYMPYGLALVASFLGLGWLFDRMEPRPKRAFVPSPHEGAGGALLALFALLAGITGLAALSDSVLGLPMRAAILIVIPLMALFWVLLTEPGPASVKTALLAKDGFRALPDSVSEICLIGATGYLGLLFSELIPPEAVRQIVEGLSMGPGMVGCATILLITLSSLLGLSPMIGGTVCAGAIIAAGIPIPEPMLMASALVGWVGALMLSPVTTTIAIAAGATGKSNAEIGLRWNGPFTLTYLAAAMAVILVWGAAL